VKNEANEYLMLIMVAKATTPKKWGCREGEWGGGGGVGWLLGWWTLKGGKLKDEK